MKELPKLLNDRVLLTRAPQERDTNSTIIIPDAHEQSPEAIVVATGPGKPWVDESHPQTDECGMILPLRIAMNVKPGDRVLVQKYGGADIIVRDAKCWIVREDEILAVL